jgi:hypothetical protein
MRYKPVFMVPMTIFLLLSFVLGFVVCWLVFSVDCGIEKDTTCNCDKIEYNTMIAEENRFMLNTIMSALTSEGE